MTEVAVGAYVLDKEAAEKLCSCTMPSALIRHLRLEPKERIHAGTPYNAICRRAREACSLPIPGHQLEAKPANVYALELR